MMSKMVPSLLALFTSLLVACAPAAAPTPEVAQPTQVPADAVLPPTPEPSPEPTEVPPTPTPQAEPLRIVDQGFGLNHIGQLGWAFIVENPNEGLAYDGVTYAVTAYDADGNVLAALDNGGRGYALGLIFPGQTTGIGGWEWLQGEVSVAKIDVQLSGGEAVAIEYATPLAVSNVAFLPGVSGRVDIPDATGVVSNPYAQEIGRLQVFIVAYNAAGEIIGGGGNLLEDLPGNGTVELTTGIFTTGFGDAIARVEMYAVPHRITSFR